jgi:SAM-dependent methyltransferase
METLHIKGLTFRLQDLTEKAAAYLKRKERRVLRREAIRFHPFHLLQRAIFPRDYQNAPIEELISGKTLMVGCKGGLETLAIGAIGLDIDKEMVHVAHELGKQAQRPASSFLAASGADMPFRDGTFDSVLSDNVIEHIPPALVPRHLRETHRVLRPGGRYVFSTPNRIFEEPPKPGHISLHSFREWEEMVRAAGFLDVKTPRRRSGALVDLEWKKTREAGARRGISLGLSHQGVRIITIVATR